MLLKSSWLRRLFPANKPITSYLRRSLVGALFKMSDVRGTTSVADIKAQIDMMRALAKDSQISTALEYYATDATTTNSSGQIIWATAIDDKYTDVAEVINTLFKRWKVNAYARSHILELATIGNLYIPTSGFYAKPSSSSKYGVALDNNTIPDNEFDIFPSTKVPPEDVLHIWHEGQPKGYIYQPDSTSGECINYPETAIIHFSLGGLLGEYTIDTRNSSGEDLTYDIQFAEPLMNNAVQPTQTLSLLEDAFLLSSFARTIKFINVDCGDAEEVEIQSVLQELKDTIEQQFAINTNTGDAQSFVNPQSPNNLIYLPKVGGQDAISITDLNMADATTEDNNLLNHFQDKKLSVIGVPKEAMNFSSNEGLGGAGSVLSQRSAIYANALQRIETAYMSGWEDALNKYFEARNMSGYVGKFILHMNPIITTQSTITFEKRDAALSQASMLVDLLKSLNVTKPDDYQSALSEILSEVFPQTGATAVSWNVKVPAQEGGSSNAL